MNIIISPTKKMKEVSSKVACTKCIFDFEYHELATFLRSLTPGEIQKSFKIKGKLLDETIELFKTLDVDHDVQPAIYKYSGIQFKYMDPESLDESSIEFLQDHLRILSGLYGVLKPLDGIVNYRLPLETEFKGMKIPNLYDYWDDKLRTGVIINSDNVILNLASNEYSKAIKKYLTNFDKIIDVFFYEQVNGKLVEKGTFAKMLRGLMTRYIAMNKIQTIEELQQFSSLGYVYSAENSDSNKLVFIKK